MPNLTPSTLVVVPARYASTRLPGKPLLTETGWPLIQHVWHQVSQATRADLVVVATDDERIYDTVLAFGGNAIMTSPEHRSGTDRVAEVARAYPQYDLIVNVQGDEPEIDPAAIDLVIAILERTHTADIATLGTWLPGRHSSPSLVKVVCDIHGDALYFSRAPIPYFRDNPDGQPPALTDTTRRGLASRHPDPMRPTMPGPLLHVGVYAYRRDALLSMAAMAPTALETAESLEQLRALEHGMRIRVGVVRDHTPGIDTPEDYAAFVDRQSRREADTRLNN